MSKKEKILLRGNQVNWNQVFYFTKVAAHGSIKDAAKQLGIQSSTLSEHISQLEKDLEVQLFHRKHRQVILTKDGVQLYHHSKEMFEVGQRFLDIVSPLHLGDYPIFIGLLPNLSLPATFDFSAKYIREIPHSNIHFQTHDQITLEKMIDDSKLDFGFSSNIPSNRNLNYTLVEIRETSFYVNKKYSKSSFEECFQKIPLIVYNSELERGGLIEKLSEAYSLHPPNIISTDYTSQILDLCERGSGIAMISSVNVNSNLIEKLTPAKNLQLPKINLYAIWSRNAENTKSVSTLLNLLNTKNVRNTISPPSQ